MLRLVDVIKQLCDLDIPELPFVHLDTTKAPLVGLCLNTGSLSMPGAWGTSAGLPYFPNWVKYKVRI